MSAASRPKNYEKKGVTPSQEGVHIRGKTPKIA